MSEVLDKITNILSEVAVLVNEPMSKHTTFKIGGNADIFVMPETEEELISVIDICKNNGTDYYVIGNGSNILVRDGGYRGVIIQLYKNYNEICVEGSRITAQCGALLSSVANTAYKAGLTGMEFASGIPGTIGGAMCMNAGAYGGEMKDITVSVRALKGKEILELSTEQAEMGYRSSRIMKEGMLVLSAVIELKKGEPDKIKEEMQRLNRQRNEKQPIELPSAGSTFKRPQGYFAAKLIDDAGLRGYRVGDAQVSEKHCGFVVNRGKATAKDVLQLIYDVKDKVYSMNGVLLEPEIRIIGVD